MSFAFEEAALAYLAQQVQQGRLPFLPERIGRWWIDDEEIDVVAINDAEKTLFVGECKWTQRPIGTNILTDLQRKAQRVIEQEKGWQIQYGLFAKSGFTPDLKTIAAKESVLLATPDDLIETMI